MNTYAIDFETYYDKETSITTLGTWHYLRHQNADIYMVAIKGPGVDFVGPPKMAPWDKIEGGRWVAHNYAFDGSCVERLHELGIGVNWKGEAGEVVIYLEGLFNPASNLWPHPERGFNQERFREIEPPAWAEIEEDVPVEELV